MLKALFKTADESAPRPAKLVDDAGALEGFAPSEWSDWFDLCEDVTLEVGGGSRFRVYTAGDARASAGVVLLLMHGAGHTALVWGRFAAAMRAQGIACVAYDARGHGASHAKEEADLSAERLAADCAALAEHTLLRHGYGVVLVGHSMGGATAVHAAKRLAGAAVRGVVVMDVVEGTAMASLTHILAAVNSRPAHFDSPAQAVRWAVDSNAVRSVESARLSVPSQLVPDGGSWRWRVDLAASRDHWAGWYSNMSQLFVSLPQPKLLLLAGTDRLDTTLMVAQMQGKYALGVFPQCGHQLHEEEPDQVAQRVASWVKRSVGIM